MMDSISNLPDETLCQILSFLSIKESAFTSLLSKRWRNLFAFRQDLNLCYVEFDFSNPKTNRSFTDFVDRVLAVSGSSTIKRVSLEIRQSCIESPHIKHWIYNILSRGILDLELDHLFGDVITLPLEIFTCKTLVKLKLGRRISVAMVPENASLPALKTLYLHYVRFSGHAFKVLLSACHVLEELTLHDHYWDGKPCQTVSCPTLKRLTLSCLFNRNLDVSFDTPRLAYLDYQNFVADKYPIVNLSSLVEAEIFFETRSDRKGNPENLIKGLRNVEILNLYSLETSKIFYSYAEAIPLFKNLTRLSIKTASKSCWKLVPLLLKKSPILETLVIEGPLHFVGEGAQSLTCECLSEYSFLSSCPVKVLEITEYNGTEVELEHMKHFMEKLPCLESVNVHASAKAQPTVTTDLLMLLGASKIQFKFFSL